MSYHSRWNVLADGAHPLEFADVAKTVSPEPWLYPGNWAISRLDGHAIYAVSPYLGSYIEPLTFRRYRGDIFGADGALPSRYSVRAWARSTGGARRFDGVGELAMQVVYRDPTHYLEILQNNQNTQVWWADDARPQSAAGWHDLGSWQEPYASGQWLRFGADVDRKAGVLTAWREGKILGQVAIPEPLRSDPAHMCIRATGNGEEWRSLSIRPD